MQREPGSYDVSGCRRVSIFSTHITQLNPVILFYIDISLNEFENLEYNLDILCEF
jgi:hypothetical protein